jgi:MFS family permease
MGDERGVRWETELYGTTGGANTIKSATRHATDKARRADLKTLQQSSLNRHYDAIAHERVSYIWVVPILLLQFAAFALANPLAKQLEADMFGSTSPPLLANVLRLKAFVACIGAPLIGAFSDRHGRTRLMKQTLLVSCVPTALLLLTAKASPVGALCLYHLTDLGRSFLSTPTLVLAYATDLIEFSAPTGLQNRAIAFGNIFGVISISRIVTQSLPAITIAANPTFPTMLFIEAEVALAIIVVCVLYAHFMLYESLEVEEEGIYTSR